MRAHEVKSRFHPSSSDDTFGFLCQLSNTCILLLLLAWHTLVYVVETKLRARITAPPASGKTHIIALCGAYLWNRNISTCIVTPNNELKYEFKKELDDVKYRSIDNLPIISIGTYVKRRTEFEFALVDEAHNLRSAVELDDELVKSIHLERGDENYNAAAFLLERDQGYFTRELNTETAHDILWKIKGKPYERTAREVLRTLSQWRSFCIASDAAVDLKFLSADPSKRNIIPKGRLLLFSATALNKEELHFYCNIPLAYLVGTNNGQYCFVSKKNVGYYHIPFEPDNDKIEFVRYLLMETAFRTLILINNNTKCLLWSRKITCEKELRERVVTIQSACNYTKRMKVYKKFISNPNRVLLTSSSVYWEGLNIKNLQLLIIPDLPIPKPSILEIAIGKHRANIRITKGRLIQGMGRIGRSPQTSGLCMLLFETKGITNLTELITEEKARYLVANLGKNKRAHISNVH